MSVCWGGSLIVDSMSDLFASLSLVFCFGFESNYWGICAVLVGAGGLMD